MRVSTVTRCQITRLSPAFFAKDTCHRNTYNAESPPAIKKTSSPNSRLETSFMESNVPPPASDTSTCCGSERRGLLKGLLAGIIGGFVALVPFLPGLAVLTSPLRKKRKIGGQMIRITTLGALAGSNLPQRFQVIAARRDAWNKYPPEPIAGVYLTPQGEGKPPRAFAVTCPHLGCAVDFNADTGEYQCPCHTSAFAADGQMLYGPSPRGLDELAVEIRGEDEIWIDYKRFEVGKSKQIEIPS